MRGHGLVLEDFERLVTELAHPIRVVLHVADVIDGLRRDAEAGVEFVALGESEVASVIDLDVGDVVVWGSDHDVKCWRVSVHLCGSSQCLLSHPVVAAFFEFEGKLFAACFDDAAVLEDVDDVRLDIV